MQRTKENDEQVSRDEDDENDHESETNEIKSPCSKTTSPRPVAKRKKKRYSLNRSGSPRKYIGTLQIVNEYEHEQNHEETVGNNVKDTLGSSQDDENYHKKSYDTLFSRSYSNASTSSMLYGLQLGTNDISTDNYKKKNENNDDEDIDDLDLESDNRSTSQQSNKWIDDDQSASISNLAEIIGEGDGTLS